MERSKNYDRKYTCPKGDFFENQIDGQKFGFRGVIILAVVLPQLVHLAAGPSAE